MNVQVVKSILGSVFLKFASSIVSFVAIPILLQNLGPSRYGIWVTVTAIVMWINFFDFGSGLTLKNKIAESKANGNSVQNIIAGTIQFYLIVTLIMFIVFIISTFSFKLFKENINFVLGIYLPIIFSFPFTLGHFMLQGIKKFNIVSLLQFMQAFLWLVIIVLFKYGIINISLTRLGISYGIISALINFLLFFIALVNINFEWNLLLDFNSIRLCRESLLTGLKFFILQISSLIIYSIGNLLTYKHLTLVDVVQYDSINKIFVLCITIFNIVIIIYWTEISQAKALYDQDLLFKLFRQLLMWAFMFSTAILLGSIMLPKAILWWTKGLVIVKMTQLYPFVLLICIQLFCCAGNVFLNAFEKLWGQIVFSVLAALATFPTTNYFFEIKYGIGAVPVSSTILAIPTLVYVLITGYSCIKNLKKSYA